MQYYQYTFLLPSDFSDILLAWLEDLPFEAFETTPTGLVAYVQAAAHTPALDSAIQDIQQHLPFSYSSVLLPAQNWNALWESNFTPVQVGTFCGIRAEFHPPFEKVAHELVIQPKMAFGTGHHETTYMMVSLMESIDFNAKTVFDFGCGTGILAILAAQLGARAVDAVDIEAASFENTHENALRNNVASTLHIYEGDLHTVPPATYSVILANINRNVILDSFPALYEKLEPEGILLISGILRTDQELVFSAAAAQSFRVVSYTERGDWLAAKLLRSSSGV